MTTYKFLHPGLGNGEFFQIHKNLVDFLQSLGKENTTLCILNGMGIKVGYGYILTVKNPEVKNKVEEYLLNNFCSELISLNSITVGHPSFEDDELFHEIDEYWEH
jgi:hypothetical protein